MIGHQDPATHKVVLGGVPGVVIGPNSGMWVYLNTGGPFAYSTKLTPVTMLTAEAAQMGLVLGTVQLTGTPRVWIHNLRGANVYLDNLDTLIQIEFVRAWVE